MLSRQSRHRLLQWIFWNPVGAAVMHRLIPLERMFDTVVRGYNLMGISNGERWLAGLMDEEPVIFDVGFHDGESTREMLKLRPRARLHAFDPSRFSREVYQRSFSQDQRVSFLNVALAAAPGEFELYDYDNMCNSLAPRKEMPGQHAKVYKVAITTLDDYCRQHGIERINFLKIDAEGYDLNVLEGATGILGRQGIDILMFEFASGWAASRRYLWEADELFKPLPYRLFHLYDGFLCPLVYDIKIDSCCTLSAMYVGVSERRLARGDIQQRNYRF